MSTKILHILFTITLLVGAILYIPSLTLTAATIEHTCKAERKKLSFNVPCQIPQFDPTKGELESIKYKLRAKTDTQIKIENKDVQLEQKANINFSSIIEIKQSTNQQTEFSFDARKAQYQTQNIPTLDSDQKYDQSNNILSFTGKGDDTIIIVDELETITDYEKTTDLENYIGTGNIDLTIVVRNNTFAIGTYDINTDIVTHAEVELVTIEYNYKPNPISEDCNISANQPVDKLSITSSCMHTSNPEHQDNTNLKHFTISSLPDSSCGTLYLDNNGNDDIEIISGMEIKPEDLSRLYFLPANNEINCPTNYTYFATDTNDRDSKTSIVTITINKNKKNTGTQTIDLDNTSSSSSKINQNNNIIIEQPTQSQPKINIGGGIKDTDYKPHSSQIVSLKGDEELPRSGGILDSFFKAESITLFSLLCLALIFFFSAITEKKSKDTTDK